ncbi:MAG: hypothetical protein DRN66_01265 [Candidatus Nanohalarchaeota archaeon]|nr:MAG: hypothetical protein DRN66_01265 [Candidatus Nanohaloarchaeota archaeon]
MNETEKIGLLSLIVNLFLCIVKLIVGVVSNSAAILAEGIHSATDIVASFIGYIGIKTSTKPKDKEHPYGHHRSETIAGFIITIILILTSLGIIYDAINAFFHPKEIIVTYLSFGVMIISVALNAIMSKLKITYGKKYDSIALITDGVHSRMDVLSSFGVLFGLAITQYWVHMDALLALLIGIYLLKQSVDLVGQTNSALVGESADEETEKKIKDVLKNQNIDLEELKTQKLGTVIFAELMIKLDPELSVNEAEGITERLKNELEKNIPALKYTVIQIKALDMKESFYKNRMAKEIRWKGRYGGKGAGPFGMCICPKCNYKTRHKRGLPCNKRKCPKCGAMMERE